VYVNEHFVFLHMPRGGGTFIRFLLEKHFPETREIGYHFPRRLLPETHHHLPILGTIRNPWAFYVSIYLRSRKAMEERTHPFYQVFVDRGLGDFRNTTKGLLNLGRDGALLDALLEVLPEEPLHGVGGMNISRACLEPIRNTDHGFYTLHFRRLYGDGSGVFLARLETLREDLLRFFASIDLEVSDALRKDVLEAPKRHAVDYSSYESYFDAELAALVREREPLFTDRFGYHFGGLEPRGRRCREGRIVADDRADGQGSLR